MKCRKDEMSGQRGLNHGFCCLQVSHLSYQDNVGVVSHKCPYCLCKRISCNRVNMALYYLTSNGIFYRVLCSDYFHKGSIEGFERGIKGGCLAAPCRPNMENNAIGCTDSFSV